MKRETYEIRGFDFTLCCALNSMYNLELGECLVQRLRCMANLKVRIDEKGEKNTPERKRLHLKKWHGEIKGVEGAYLSISEVENYLTRVSLFYNEGDEKKMEDIKAVLRGVQTRHFGKKSLLDYSVDDSKEQAGEKDKVYQEKLPRCAMYSSD